MNSLERISRFIAGETVDRIPVTPILMQYASKFIRAPFSKYLLNYKTLVESHLRCQEEFNFDMLMTLSDAYRETFDFGADVEFPYDNLPLMKNHLVDSYTDIKKLELLDPLKSTRMYDRIRAVELYKEKAGNEMPILGWIEGPLAEIVDLRGLSNIMTDLYENMDFINDMIDIVMEVAKKFALEQIKVGAHFIGIGDAACSIISPDMYRDIFMPKEKELVDFIHDNGAKAKLHICGNTTNHVKYMVETNSNIIDLDWMVPISESVKYLKIDQVFSGNFDPVSVLLNGTSRTVREACLKCVKEGERRLILSAGCEVVKDTPYQNMKEFCSVYEY